MAAIAPNNAHQHIIGRQNALPPRSQKQPQLPHSAAAPKTIVPKSAAGAAVPSTTLGTLQAPAFTQGAARGLVSSSLAPQSAAASVPAAYAAAAQVSTATPQAAVALAKPAVDTAWDALIARRPAADTAANRTTFTALFNQSVKEGRSVAVASAFAEHVLLDGDAAVRNQLMAPANWTTGSFAYKNSVGVNKTLAEAATLMEWKTLGWDGLLKFMGNYADVSQKYLATIAIEKLVEGCPTIATDQVRSDQTAFAEALAKISRETGETLSKVLAKVGQGQLAAVGGVLEALGIAYQARYNDKTLSQMGASMVVGARFMKAYGTAINNTDLKAAAELAAATGTMFQKWAQDNGGNRNNALTQGVAQFIAGMTGGVALLTGNKKLGAISGTAWSATALLSGWDPSHNLTDLLKGGKYTIASAKIGQLGLSLAGTLVGGKTGALLSNLGEVFGIGADSGKLWNAISATPPAVGSAAYKTWLAQGISNEVEVFKVGVRLLQVGFKFAGITLPATAQTILNHTLNAVSGPLTAEAVRTAGIGMAWFVHDAIKLGGGGINAAQKAFATISDSVSGAAGTVGKIAGWAGTAVQAAYLLTDVFQNGWTHANQIGAVNLGASIMGMAVGGVAGAAIALPMAAVTAFFGSRTIVSIGSLESLKTVGGVPFNMGMVNGNGPVWTPGAVPIGDAAYLTSAIKNDYYEQTRYGIYGWSKDGWFVGVQGGNITVLGETALGQMRLWMGSFADGTNYLSVAQSTFGTLRTLRGIDNALAAALNKADIRHGQTVTGVKSLVSAAVYNAVYKAGETANGQAGATVRKFLTMDETPNPYNNFYYGLSTSLKDFGTNLPGMIDYRYANFANKMGATGTIAGQSFNAWYDLLTSKNTVSPTLGRGAAIVDFIAKNGYLLDIPATMVAKIGALVKPGTMNSVMNQAIPLAATYKKLSLDPVVKALKLTADQILHVAQILVGPRH